MKIASKMQLARIASRLAIGVGPSTRTVSRRGINWELDLKDAIDLSIYLRGGFQRRTFEVLRELACREGDVIEVGCNRGALTIPLSLAKRHGRILALDPVRMHCESVKLGLALNSPIPSKVVVEQAFVGSSISVQIPIEVGAIWSLRDFSTSGDEICASPCSTDGAMATSIDDVVARHEIGQLSVIKIDVDGYELEVIKGASVTLQQLSPPIVMEWSPIAMSMRGVSPSDLAMALDESGYMPSIIQMRGVNQTSWNDLSAKTIRRTSIDLLLTK